MNKFYGIMESELMELKQWSEVLTEVALQNLESKDYAANIHLLAVMLEEKITKLNVEFQKCAVNNL